MTQRIRPIATTLSCLALATTALTAQLSIAPPAKPTATITGAWFKVAVDVPDADDQDPNAKRLRYHQYWQFIAVDPDEPDYIPTNDPTASLTGSGGPAGIQVGHHRVVMYGEVNGTLQQIGEAEMTLESADGMMTGHIDGSAIDVDGDDDPVGDFPDISLIARMRQAQAKAGGHAQASFCTLGAIASIDVAPNRRMCGEARVRGKLVTAPDVQVALKQKL